MKHNPFYYLIHIDKTVKRVLTKLSPQYALKQDRLAIEKLWKDRMDYPLNLDNPRTFCEKLQWLKLYDRNPLYHKLVDKYEVKNLVADKIGAEHVAECYGVWNSLDEIDFSLLPSTFVLKCTHTSGGMAIVQDKSQVNREDIKQKLEPFLLCPSWYANFKEWAYKDIPPRIIAEEYIDTLGKPSTTEYKITCIHGRVKMITVCTGKAHGNCNEWHNDHYNRDGIKLDFSIRPSSATDRYIGVGTPLPSQQILHELIDIAEKLSEGIPQVRVDLYVHRGKVMFGEMTFYTWAGFMDYNPKEWDLKMGEWLPLDKK